jgi:hypothetical protein
MDLKGPMRIFQIHKQNQVREHQEKCMTKAGGVTQW